MKATLNTLKCVNIVSNEGESVNTFKGGNTNNNVSSSNSKFIMNRQLLTSFSPKGSTETNFQQYGQEMAYYRKVIEHMQEEIGGLNTKIKDIEKLNDGVKKITIREDETKQLRQIEKNQGILNNTRNDALEDKIKKLENMVMSLTHMSKYSITSPKAEIVSNAESGKILSQKKEKEKEYEANQTNHNLQINRYSREPAKNLKARSKSELKLGRNINNNNGVEKKVQSVYKTNSKEKINKKVPVTVNKEILVLKEENRKLRERIAFLEEKDNSHRMLEDIDGGEIVDFWKRKCGILEDNYHDAINGLRNQLENEKKVLVDQIKLIAYDSSKQIQMIQHKYHDAIEEIEKNYHKLKKENEDMKKKFSKVKNILSTSRTEK